jgi:hypothetical protein
LHAARLRYCGQRQGLGGGAAPFVQLANAVSAAGNAPQPARQVSARGTGQAFAQVTQVVQAASFAHSCSAAQQA